MDYDTVKQFVETHHAKRLRVQTLARHVDYDSTFVLQGRAVVATSYDKPIHIAIEHIVAISEV